MSGDLLEQATGVVLDADETGPEQEVLALLERSKDERPRGSLRNVLTTLERDRRWRSRIRYNEFAGSVEVRLGEDRAWRLVRDEDEVGVYRWLAETYRLETSTQRVNEAIRFLARQQGYHPVREYLGELAWDGHPRIHALLTHYFGAAATPLHQALSRRWLVSCCARVYQPGVKVDTVLILAGDQGLGKSRGLRALVPDSRWFSDSSIDFRSKDAYQVLSGIWIYELAELDSYRRSEATSIKAFLSAQEDRYRPSYGRNVVHVPRQTVFAGTTNEGEFLSDPTGSRRSWPVTVSRVAVEEIERDRDQLWAEAVAAWRSGEPWWLDTAQDRELRDHSEQYRQVDAWEVALDEWLRDRLVAFTVSDALAGIGIKPPDQTRPDSMRAAGILKALGCTKGERQRSADGARYYPWLPPRRTP